jgi:hypothetical protein
MIPYEDLVVALQTWRARRGLPVGQMSGSIATPPPAIATPPPVARTAPPMRPPTTPAARPPAPAPLAPPDEHMDVGDDALLEEAHYESEGGNFSMNFPAGVQRDSEATAIGVAPPRPSDATMVSGDPSDIDGLPPPPMPSRKRGEDW